MQYYQSLLGAPFSTGTPYPLAIVSPVQACGASAWSNIAKRFMEGVKVWSSAVLAHTRPGGSRAVGEI